MNKLKTFIQDSRQELKKVHWPTKKETKKLTVAVLVLSIFFAIILSSMDFILSKIIYPIIF